MYNLTIPPPAKHAALFFFFSIGRFWSNKHFTFRFEGIDSFRNPFSVSTISQNSYVVSYLVTPVIPVKCVCLTARAHAMTSANSSANAASAYRWAYFGKRSVSNPIVWATMRSAYVNLPPMRYLRSEPEWARRAARISSRAFLVSCTSAIWVSFLYFHCITAIDTLRTGYVSHLLPLRNFGANRDSADFKSLLKRWNSWPLVYEVRVWACLLKLVIEWMCFSGKRVGVFDLLCMSMYLQMSKESSRKLPRIPSLRKVSEEAALWKSCRIFMTGAVSFNGGMCPLRRIRMYIEMVDNNGMWVTVVAVRDDKCNTTLTTFDKGELFMSHNLPMAGSSGGEVGRLFEGADDERVSSAPWLLLFARLRGGVEAEVLIW